jgi:hypothetical protein
MRDVEVQTWPAIAGFDVVSLHVIFSGTGFWLAHDSDVRPLDSLIQIGVLKHQQWALAAGLECDVLHVDGGGTHDVAASRGAARESNLVDSLVSGENRSSRLAVSRHDVDDARRESCFFDERGQVECRQGCLFCGLENDCVATRQSGALKTSC